MWSPPPKGKHASPQGSSWIGALRFHRHEAQKIHPILRSKESIDYDTMAPLTEAQSFVDAFNAEYELKHRAFEVRMEQVLIVVL
jgi:hypothetical protein